MKKHRSLHKLNHGSSRKATNLNRADITSELREIPKPRAGQEKDANLQAERVYLHTNTTPDPTTCIVPKHKTTDNRTRFHILLFGIQNCIHNNLRSSGEQPHHLRTATTNVVAKHTPLITKVTQNFRGLILTSSLWEELGYDGAAICEELGGRVGARDTP